PEEAVRLVERHQASACNGATPFLKGLLDAAQAAGKHLPSLTNGGYGGAAVPPELLYQACAWFPNLVTFRIYGCTECPTATGRIATRAELDHGCRTDGLIRHTEIRLADPVTGAPAAPGAEGEILLRGATMMLGYLRPEDNAGAFDAEGFFRSGDLGRIVDGHYLVVTGRKKDLIIRNGENLSPQEIEDALFAHPGIDAVAVVGMPSAKTGEAVCAFVVPKPGHTIDLPDIARHLVAQGLARQKIPEHLELVERLPTSPQGKVLKTELRETARRLAASPAGGESTSALLNLN
ncbi:MAG TPA: AMP-binding protein, partial [Novosphingobium sp.]